MTTRRNFLQQAGLLTAGIIIAPSCMMSKAESNKNIGIQLYTLREELPKDAKGVIGKVAQAGYKEVETFGYSSEGGFFGMKPTEFADLLKQHELKAPSGHFGFDPYISGENEDLLKSYIDAAKAVDMKYIIVPYLGENLRQSAADYQRVAERLSKAAEQCKAAGLQLGYHNHDFEFKKFGDTTGYEILLKETDPDLVVFEADLYWVVRAGLDPVALFKDHPGRFKLWHVKDMDKANPKINTEIGSGSVNFKEIFANAEVAGVEHYIVEQENFSLDPFESIAQSHTYLKENLL